MGRCHFPGKTGRVDNRGWAMIEVCSMKCRKCRRISVEPKLGGVSGAMIGRTDRDFTCVSCILNAPLRHEGKDEKQSDKSGDQCST